MFKNKIFIAKNQKNRYDMACDRIVTNNIKGIESWK